MYENVTVLTFSLCFSPFRCNRFPRFHWMIYIRRWGPVDVYGQVRMTAKCQTMFISLLLRNKRIRTMSFIWISVYIHELKVCEVVRLRQVSVRRVCTVRRVHWRVTRGHIPLVIVLSAAKLARLIAYNCVPGQRWGVDSTGGIRYTHLKREGKRHPTGKHQAVSFAFLMSWTIDREVPTCRKHTPVECLHGFLPVCLSKESFLFKEMCVWKYMTFTRERGCLLRVYIVLISGIMRTHLPV